MLDRAATVDGHRARRLRMFEEVKLFAIGDKYLDGYIVARVHRHADGRRGPDLGREDSMCRALGRMARGVARAFGRRAASGRRGRSSGT